MSPLEKNELFSVLVIGGGAIGLTTAAALVHAGSRVSFCVRPYQMEILAREGLQFNGIGKTLNIPAEFLNVTTCIQSLENFDLIIVATKGYSISESIADLKSLAAQSPKAPFLLLQNGYGPSDVLAKFLPRERILNASVQFSANINEVSSVTLNAVFGTTILGSVYDDEVPQVAYKLASIFDKFGIPALASNLIKTKIWEKMITNVVVNPVAFLSLKSNGELVQDEPARRAMTKLAVEAYNVIGASGIALPWTSANEYLEYLFSYLLPITKNHRASMLQDRVRSRKTEVEYLNGTISQIGIRFNVDCPYNNNVYHAVKAVEDKYLKGNSAVILHQSDFGLIS